MATARYTIMIPTHDELGRAIQVATAAHQHVLESPVRVESATVHHGNPYDALSVWAEDTPQSDSLIKQVGVYAGEVANVSAITVTKEGKSGASWQMKNPHYQPQVGAEPSALLQYGMSTNMAGGIPYTQ